MAHMSVNQYLQQIDEALMDENGDTVAELLSCKHPHIASPRLQIDKPYPVVQRVLKEPWDEVVSAHLKCIYYINNHDFVEAYNQQYYLVQIFTKILQSQKEENWALPIMYTCCLDLRCLASSADVQLVKKGKTKPEDMLEKAAELIMGFFRVCVGDTRSSQEATKRWGILFLTNQLFKIYFKINKLHLVKPLLRAIESSNLKDSFPKAQRVTYKFYVGQKAMFESEFKTAEEHLSFAFIHCHKNCKKNKRLILIYLTPVKMLLGKIPKPSVLKKYDLLPFSEVAQAVVQGNLVRLNKALEANETFFIKCGIYLILERLKIIVYRNLFKKVYLMYSSNVVPVDAFLDALKVMEVEDIDREEALAILANLIYEGKIKGYISYQHQKVVFSKQNAFPLLSSLS